MPYDYPDNIPDYIEGLPGGAQRIFVSAFNSTLERTNDEDQARIAGWGAVKNVYEQNAEGEWIRKTAKEGSLLNLSDIETVAKAYSVHNKVHSDYMDARYGSRRKVEMQNDHEEIVRHILALGGHHISKGEALDATLPEELKAPAKLRYISDSITLADTKPVTSSIQVFRTGTFYHPTYGKITITEDTLKNMVKNFNENKPRTPTEMVVDYDHLSIENEEPVGGEAAGWVKALTNGSALFAEVEWTDEAANRIRDKKFRFISPEWHMNYPDKESNKTIGPTLLSVALTNRPFLEGMEPVVLSDELAGSFMFSEQAVKAMLPMEEQVAIDDAKAALEAGVGGKEKSNFKEAVVEEELRKLLGIDEESDILETVRALKAKADEPAQGTEEVQNLTNQLAGETKRANDLQAEKDATELETIVDEAITAKKLLPKQKEVAMAMCLKDKAGFVAYLETVDVVGPDMKILGKVTSPKNLKVSEQEAMIAKKLGVTEEMLMKQKELDEAAGEEE